MKKFFSIFIMLVSLNAFALDSKQIAQTSSQIKEDVITVVEKGENLVGKLDSIDLKTNLSLDSIHLDLDESKYSKEITSFLKTTAHTLGVAVENVFDVIVLQQVVKSITYLIALIGIGFTVIRSWKHLMKYRDQNPKLIDQSPFPYLIAIVTTAFLVYFSSTHLYTIVTGFINPKFGAYLDIIEFIKQVR